MERLTLEEAICRVRGAAKKQRWNSKYTKVSLMNEELNKRHKDDCIKDAEEYEQLAEWLEELKSYKEAEEQGLLVRLPCKVGTEVFAILSRDSHYTKCQIKKIEIRQTIFGKICYFAEPVAQRGCCFRYFDNEFGKVIFLTREEAKKKLEEMRNV